MMLLVRSVITCAAMLVLACAGGGPAARASFIMSPVSAAPQSSLSYQPAGQAGKPGPLPQTLFSADLDGLLAQPDLAASAALSLSAEGGEAAPQPDGKTVLPEPATIAMLGVGLLSLAFLRRAGA